MSQAPENIEKDPEFRWDFADIILGGNEGKSTIIKHQNPKSDIADRKDIIRNMWDYCVQMAFNNQHTNTPYGPVGKIVLRDFAYEHLDEELHEAIRFRVNVQPSVKGAYFCMRRINGIIPPLQKQGYADQVIDKLMQRQRRGLVLFGGEMGAGKTSAASSMISAWLRRNGGSAVTLEDPPEYNLHGAHMPENAGDVGGFCIQRASSSKEMADEIPTLMRASAPEIIFLGEIRDAAVAHEVLLAASNGHLIVSTIHGKGIEGCLNRIMSMASAGGNMSIDDTAKLLSESLSMIIYQDLLRQKGTGVKILRLRHIDLLEGKYTKAIQTKLRERKIELLGDDIGDPIQNKSSL